MPQNRPGESQSFVPQNAGPIPIKILGPNGVSPKDHYANVQVMKVNKNSVEMKRLVLSIYGKLPNVVAAGADLSALRHLLRVQLAEAASMKPGVTKPANTTPI